MTRESPVLYKNLNSLRMFLALLVTWSHCYPLTNGGPELFQKYIGSLSGGGIAVKGFFFISGYLVTASWVRSESWGSFAWARFLRLWPALTVSLLVTVLLASLSSIAPASELLPSVKNYFLDNILIFDGVRYEIAGAYKGLPESSVNGSLWTLPWEVRCYALIAFLGVFGVLSADRGLASFSLIIAFIAVVVAGSRSSAWFDNSDAPIMVAAFIAGALVERSLPTAGFRNVAVSLVFCALAFYLIKMPSYGNLFVICGLCWIAGFGQGKGVEIKDDISYGIYVYSFPVQQFFLYKFKIFDPLLLFFCVLPVILVMAIVSWRIIEKPCLAFKKFNFFKGL